jgi:hypothetical protein
MYMESWFCSLLYRYFQYLPSLWSLPLTSALLPNFDHMVSCRHGRAPLSVALHD